MSERISRRGFLKGAGAAATAIPLGAIGKAAIEEADAEKERSATSDNNRIVDIHIHFDEKNPNFIRDLVTLADRINLTACLLTPYAYRSQVASAARQYPKQIVPFGFIDLDAPDVLAQVRDFHALGYRGLGELEFVQKPYTTTHIIERLRRIIDSTATQKPAAAGVSSAGIDSRSSDS